jgi:protein-disulfide isomerase/rhodanese-related sulfurtransferase
MGWRSLWRKPTTGELRKLRALFSAWRENIPRWQATRSLCRTSQKVVEQVIMRKSISLILALLGLFDSLYLFWIYTSPSRPMVCLGTGCDAVRASVYSHLGGIPMPVLGVAGYVIVALLIMAESLVPAARAIDVRYALAGATGFGFLFSLYLEYLQGFVIHAFCVWCVTSGLVMTALCGLAVYNVVRPAPEADPYVQLAQVRSYLVVSVAAVLIGVPAFYELAAHGEAPPPPPPPPNETTADKLVRPDSHATGNLNAAVTVVEFGDFECPVCGREEPVAQEIRAKYAKQIRFVFRQFPLIHAHPFSERMAEASECAAEQGKFWEAVDEIYSHQTDLSDDGLKRDAAAIGLDQGRFNQCLASGAEAGRVKRDRDDGKALGVNATPTFFIGHQVISGVPDFDEFSRMVDRELLAQGFGLSSPPTPTAVPSSPAAVETKKPPKLATASQKAAPEQSSTEPAASSFGLLGSPPGGALSSFQTGVACSEAEAAMKQPSLINTSQLQEILTGKAKPLFVDVRPAKEFAEGQIPGAINIPVDDMPQRWSSLPKGRVVVFYESGQTSGDICASGRAAGRILLEHGYAFDQVKVYQDGLAGWKKSGLDTSQ